MSIISLVICVNEVIANFATFRYTIAYTYLGSLMRQLTDIFTDDSTDSTQQIIFLSIGGVRSTFLSSKSKKTGRLTLSVF